MTARGRRDATAVGTLLGVRQWQPDVVACSTARRTRDTWDCAVAGGASAGEVHYVDRIYLAGVPDLLEVLRSLPSSARTALVVGHLPGIADLLGFLTASRESTGSDRSNGEFPTASLAVVSVPDQWSAAGPARSELTAFEIVRG